MGNQHIHVGSGGNAVFRRRSIHQPRYTDSVDLLSADIPYSSESHSFVLERALVDGSLPDPSPEAEQDGWIGTYQWDELIYLWQTVDINSRSTTIAGLNSAYVQCNLNADVSSRREKSRRKERLFAGLEESGLLEFVSRTPGGRYTVRRLMLAPLWTVDGLVPSGEPRNWHNLRKPGRTWFMMPNVFFEAAPISGRTMRSRWSQLSHADRRTLVTLYSFYDHETFGAIDPNHLCLRGEQLVVSDQFIRSCGGTKRPPQVLESLGELWRRDYLDFLRADFPASRVYPASERDARWARRSSDPDSADALVGLRYVPLSGSDDHERR